MSRRKTSKIEQPDKPRDRATVTLAGGAEGDTVLSGGPNGYIWTGRPASFDVETGAVMVNGRWFAVAPPSSPPMLVVCHGYTETDEGFGVVSRLNPTDGTVLWTADLGSLTLTPTSGPAVTVRRRAVHAAIDSEGNIVVAWDLGRHHELSLQWQNLPQTWSAGVVPNGGVAKLDTDGNLLWSIALPAARLNSGTLLSYNASGSPFALSAQVAIDPDDRIWIGTVGDANFDYIYQLASADGALQQTFGHTNSFTFPHAWPAATGRYFIEKQPSQSDIFAARITIQGDGKILFCQPFRGTIVRMSDVGAVEYATRWDSNRSITNVIYGLGNTYQTTNHHEIAATQTGSVLATTPLSNNYDYIRLDAWWQANGRPRFSQWYNAKHPSNVGSTSLPPDAVGVGPFPVTAHGPYTQALRRYGPGEAATYAGNPTYAAYYADPLFDYKWRLAHPRWMTVLEAGISLPPLSYWTGDSPRRTWDWNNLNGGSGGYAGKTSLALGDSAVAFGVSTALTWRQWSLSTTIPQTWFDLNVLPLSDTSWNVFAAEPTTGAVLWCYLFGKDRSPAAASVGATKPAGTVLTLWAAWAFNSATTVTTTADFIVPALEGTVTISVASTAGITAGGTLSDGVNAYRVLSLPSGTSIEIRNDGQFNFTQQRKLTARLHGLCATDSGFVAVGSNTFLIPPLVESISAGGQRVWQTELGTNSTTATAFSAAFRSF